MNSWPECDKMHFTSLRQAMLIFTVNEQVARNNYLCRSPTQIPSSTILDIFHAPRNHCTTACGCICPDILP